MAAIPHVPIAAEVVTQIAGFPVTNTLVNSTVAVLFFVLIGLVIRLITRERPGRLQAGAEMLLEGLLSFFDQVTHDRAKSRRFLPIVGTLFLFILVSNWMGLLPGTGSIGVHALVHGEMEFIPLLRPANSDLNLTLAMALVAVIGAHVIAMFTIGPWTHLNKFIQISPLVKAIASLNATKIMTAVVEFIVGFIEIFSELAKIASLSLRLFGNIFAGEVLMTVIAALVAWFVPLPFMAIEILVGVVQATVFSMLTLVYLTVLSSAPHGSHESHSPEPGTHNSEPGVTGYGLREPGHDHVKA